MFISSAVMATLFFGGYDLPFFNPANHTANFAATIDIITLTTLNCIKHGKYINSNSYPIRLCCKV